MTKGEVGEDTSIKSIPKPDTTSKWSDLKFQNVAFAMYRAIDGPVTYLRDKIVVPIQAKNQEKWYHRKFNRVPTVDQCDVDDIVCIYEAEQQFLRDKKVEANIVKILRNKKTECLQWEGADMAYKCKNIIDTYEDAATNWFIKYGDLRRANYRICVDAYMKQKHRMIWERRNPDKKLH